MVALFTIHTAVSREKPRGVDPVISNGLGHRTDQFETWGCASQFDPVIDKERKVISNLR
jgi:hypothetical protein